jgi:hypothetical protein
VVFRGDKTPADALMVSDLLTVTGLRSATEERARRSAREQFARQLADHLEPAVPRNWKIPGRLIDGMILSVSVKPVERDYGTVYEATLKADVSHRSRARVVQEYRREEVWKRVLILGAVLAFVLVALAVISGYIKTDEATKGYYTNRLRFAAAAGLGAAAALIFQWLRS